MTPYDTALQTILAKVRPLPAERVPLEAAAGRALVDDAVADRSLPERDNSAMDGYAVRAADLTSASASAPVALSVVGRIAAGEAPTESVGPGQAARIFTGATLPPGADAVVMQEDVERTGESARFRAPVEVGAYVRKAGHDIEIGEGAVASGCSLRAAELALLAALGHTHVRVGRVPKVAIISTGDELVGVGQARPGRLVDSNAVALGIRLAQLGAQPVQLGIAPDDPAAIRALFQAARGCDVVLSSAGVSVGERDYVKDVLRALGATLHLERVAIRPGKPLVFASTPEQLYFGLPGNPVSSRVTFEVFVVPALRALLGIRQQPAPVWAELAEDVGKVEALTFFTRVALRQEGSRLRAWPVENQSSGALTSLVRAQGLAVLPAGHAAVRAGTPVRIIELE